MKHLLKAPVQVFWQEDNIDHIRATTDAKTLTSLLRRLWKRDIKSDVRQGGDRFGGTEFDSEGKWVYWMMT